MWLQNVLGDLRIKQRVTSVYQINAEEIEWAKVGSSKHKSSRKYVDNRHIYVIALKEKKKLI